MTERRADLSALPNWPRLLDAEEAARYVGISRNSFDALVEQGVFSKPVRLFKGAHRPKGLWDRLQLDRDVDKLAVDVLPATQPRVLTPADALEAAKTAHQRRPANGNRGRRHEGQGFALRHPPA